MDNTTQNDSQTELKVAPDIRLFVNEDLSKSENRINVALLNVLMVPPFRHWFLGRLGVAPDCVVYPPQNMGVIRPDLVVVDRAGFVQAWIEIELGAENTEQVERYRRELHGQVHSIVGLRDSVSGPGMSLEELAKTAAECVQESLDPQQKKTVQIFVDLVAQVGQRSIAVDYAVPGDTVKHEVLIKGLSDRLGSLLTYGKPPVQPGLLQVSTITQKGWTLRVYAKNTTYGSISILWKQAIPGHKVRVPSYEQLLRYLDPNQVDTYREFFFDGLGLDIGQITGQQSLAVDENRLLEVLDAYAASIRSLIKPSRL